MMSLRTLIVKGWFVFFFFFFFFFFSFFFFSSSHLPLSLQVQISDPYVVISKKIKGKWTVVGKTKKQQEKCNPKWGFSMEKEGAKEVEAIKLVVKANYFGKTDEFMGEVVCPFLFFSFLFFYFLFFSFSFFFFLFFLSFFFFLICFFPFLTSYLYSFLN